MSFLEPCETCGGNPTPIVLDYQEPDNRELVLRSIYQDDFPKDRAWVENTLFYGDTLWRGLLKTIKQNKLSNDTPSNRSEWLNRQHNNLYRFATAKSYAEVLEYRNQIISPDTGKTRSFDEFKKVCDDLGRKYKENWLKTEYNAVINGTIAGVNWLEFQENKDLFPYLKYEIVDDNRTRDAHRQLRGIIEKIDSQFWQKFYPPNGWNCRCYTTQVSDRMAEHYGYKENTNENIRKAKSVVKDKYWHRNTGTQTLFDENNTAYFEAMPGKGKKQLSATKNYGLSEAKKILERTDLPKAIVGAKEDVDTIWDNMTTEGNLIKVKCKFGIERTFDEEFKKHIIKENHVEDLPNLTETLQDPSEVWSGWLSGRTNRWYKKYIKYYDKGAYLILIDNEGKPITMYRVKDLSKVEELRNGILEYKK